MSQAVIDLSRSPRSQRKAAAEDLIGRCAAILNADPAMLAVAPDEVSARERVDGLVSRVSEGVIALDSPTADAPALYRLGEPDAPLFLVDAKSKEIAAGLRWASVTIAPILVQRAAMSLTPAARKQAHVEHLQLERLLEQVLAALGPGFEISPDSAADKLVFDSADPAEFERRLDAIGLKLDREGSRFIAWTGGLKGLSALAAHLGANRTRAAALRRSTKETDIALFVDLDATGSKIDTGVKFFDHMLEQVAKHGGIRIEIKCEGDVEVDAHHTIEDVCLALGDGLREALGDKKGIGRYGFSLPMDETRASVWIDLSGRPYFRFDGEIPGERVGDYPVEMCAHAFRSISETLRAAIHVEVNGENAHHMVEACYKAFARALKQAVAVNGADLPSTKGVL